MWGCHAGVPSVKERITFVTTITSRNEIASEMSHLPGLTGFLMGSLLLLIGMNCQLAYFLQLWMCHKVLGQKCCQICLIIAVHVLSELNVFVPSAPQLLSHLVRTKEKLKMLWKKSFFV